MVNGLKREGVLIDFFSTSNYDDDDGNEQSTGIRWTEVH